MRRSLKNEKVGKICVPIVHETIEEALRAIKEVDQVADLIELRMDYLKKPGLPLLMKERQRPFIVINRRKEEGGRYWSNERRRVEVLKEAIDLGAEYVDVEIGTEKPLCQDLIENKKETKVILSFHNFHGTPSSRELTRLYERMMQLGPDIVKIVTFATSWEDNFRILSLISHAKKKKQGMVAFCMGEKGKMSRIFGPSMGATWTYASMSKNQTSAPGQLTIGEMRGIWENLR